MMLVDDPQVSISVVQNALAWHRHYVKGMDGHALGGRECTTPEHFLVRRLLDSGQGGPQLNKISEGAAWPLSMFQRLGETVD
jgi:hypothetical protein